jgi:hydrogenase expression/formation protein HypD
MNNIEQNLKKIKNLAKQLDHIKLMELCGTHSQTIAKYNIKSLIPENIELISGPGCPICVTDQEDIDIVIGLALNNIPIAIYGDALTLPGSQSNLEKSNQQGKNIFVVYSTQDALKLQKNYPKLVFFGIGFETTTPMTAWVIKNGLTVYSSHKLFPPAMAALLADSNIQIDGFINPGHVSAIIGTKPYNKFNFPQVITGFEPEDTIESIKLLLEMIINNEKKVINQYKRVVTEKGNTKAMDLIHEVFEVSDAAWRGLGNIANSGLKIRSKFQNQDAEFIYHDLITKIKKEIKPIKNACICGQILKGIKTPADCSLFKHSCKPENPQGSCMVSVEGTCHIDYKYS